jgi:hypothetical protein
MLAHPSPNKRRPQHDDHDAQVRIRSFCRSALFFFRGSELGRRETQASR